MLMTPDIQWTILCATYRLADKRGQQLQRCAEGLRQYGANVVGIDFLGRPDCGTILHDQGFREWKKVLRGKLVAYRPDFVLTHNRLGEYGHPHHMALSAMTRQLYRGPINHFYFRAPSSVGPQEELDEVLTIKLPREIIEKKQRIMKTAYADVIIPITWNQPELMYVCFREESFTCAS